VVQCDPPEEAVHLACSSGLYSALHSDNPIAPSGELHLPGVSPGELTEGALDGQALAVEVDGDALGDWNWSLADTRLLGFDSEHALGWLRCLVRGSCIVDE
jgi:hypothetical protein